MNEINVCNDKYDLFPCSTVNVDMLNAFIKNNNILKQTSTIY